MVILRTTGEFTNIVETLVMVSELVSNLAKFRKFMKIG